MYRSREQVQNRNDTFEHEGKQHTATSFLERMMDKARGQDSLEDVIKAFRGNWEN